jgi:hypothetical protein
MGNNTDTKTNVKLIEEVENAELETNLAKDCGVKIE